MPVKHNQKGYVGSSMSVRAQEAYENGEMPKSKWTKSKIISEIERVFDKKTADYFRPLSLPMLFKTVMKKSSWHHTSKMANATDFYSLSKPMVEITIKNQKNGIKHELMERMNYYLRMADLFKANIPKYKKEYEDAEKIINALISKNPGVDLYLINGGFSADKKFTAAKRAYNEAIRESEDYKRRAEELKKEIQKIK